MAKKKIRKSRKKRELKVRKKAGMKKEDKQLLWFFIVVFLVFASFLGGYFYFQSLKSFNYAGVDWIKEDMNGLKLYHSVFPTFYDSGISYNLYLRNDPRTNNISVNAVFIFKPEVIVSWEPEAGACKNAILSSGNIAMFLTQAGGLKVEGAITNESVAKELNMSFADCNSAGEKTVVLIKKSEEPKIVQKTQNCYVIEIGNCQNIEAAEKFILAVLAQTKGAKLT